MFKLLSLLALVTLTLSAPAEPEYYEGRPPAVHDPAAVARSVVTTPKPKPTVIVTGDLVDEDDAAMAKERAARVIEIIDAGSEQSLDGSYSFHFRGEDGSYREEVAVVKNPGTKDEHLEIEGAYSFIDSQGKEVVVNYQAGTHGFVPQGGNIPIEISAAAKLVSENKPVVVAPQQQQQPIYQQQHQKPHHQQHQHQHQQHHQQHHQQQQYIPQQPQHQQQQYIPQHHQ